MARPHATDFAVRLAQTPQDLRAAQRLRYDVFVTELGGEGPMVDHAQRLERDRFDPFSDHLLLIDTRRDAVVGVYRLMQNANAAAAGGFYSSAEYDLSTLLRSNRKLLELGRSCLHPDYRGGTGMHVLWSALAQYVAEHQIEVLFGVASFHGTDVHRLAAPLSLLHARHLASDCLRVRALEKSFQNMDLIPSVNLDRKAAMRQIPSLIKAYLRLGGCVGEGAYIDHAFNTVDVCLILDTTQINARQGRIYGAATA
tara:strand:- start:1093 stop:1857 length:765 start_codon:yes stop_codon:yes gene_type:complete